MSLVLYASFFPQFIKMGTDIVQQLLIFSLILFVIVIVLTAIYSYWLGMHGSSS